MRKGKSDVEGKRKEFSFCSDGNERKQYPPPVPTSRRSQSLLATRTSEVATKSQVWATLRLTGPQRVLIYDRRAGEDGWNVKLIGEKTILCVEKYVAFLSIGTEHANVAPVRLR